VETNAKAKAAYRVLDKPLGIYLTSGAGLECKIFDREFDSSSQLMQMLKAAVT